MLISEFLLKGSNRSRESNAISRHSKAKESSAPIFERIISTVWMEWPPGYATTTTTSPIKTRGKHDASFHLLLHFFPFVSFLSKFRKKFKSQCSAIIKIIFDSWLSASYRSLFWLRLHYNTWFVVLSCSNPERNRLLCHTSKQICFHSHQSVYHPVKVRCTH